MMAKPIWDQIQQVASTKMILATKLYSKFRQNYRTTLCAEMKFLNENALLRELIFF